MAPPPKKRRIISDDEDDGSSNSKDEPSTTNIHTLTRQKDTRPKTRNQSTKGTQAVVRSFPPSPVKSTTSTSTSSKLAKKQTLLVPQKIKASSRLGSQEDPIVDRRGNANVTQTSKRGPVNKKKKVSAIAFSQIVTEEDDDLIESDLSDGWTGSEFSVLSTSKDTKKTTTKVAKDVKAQNVVPKELQDPRTWAEKYAPQTTAELAVHKAKITEVRGWIEQVLAGRSRKCLCVLNGPSGCGKTAVVSALSKEMDLDVIEWKNPMGTDYGRPGTTYENLTSQFSEFLERSVGYETLDLVYSGGTDVDVPRQEGDSSRRKIILIEDLPNIFTTTSSSTSPTLKAFRDALLAFLSTPQPASSSPIPCILIVSESLSSQSHTTSITPHRLLGSQILNHHKLTSISFNKIAPTILQKSLEKIVSDEVKRIGMKTMPSKALIAGLGESGDIRSAINAIEFMMVAGDSGNFTNRTLPLNGTKKKKESTELTGNERATLELITQRETSFGIFHAIGKVIYNKRLNDDTAPSSKTRNIQAGEINPEPPDHLKHYNRRPSLVDINSLIETIGTDVSTFISGIHENYLTSCAGDNLVDHMDDSIDALSDADILSSGRWEDVGKTLSGGDGNRQEDFAFQTAVRGVLLSLPSPVKRPSGKTQIYYPMALRLWQEREDIEGVISVFVADSGMSILKTVPPPRQSQSQGHTNKLLSAPGVSATPSSSLIAASKLEMTLDVMPYLYKIWQARRQSLPSSSRSSHVVVVLPTAVKQLQKVVLFRGVAGQSEDIPDIQAPIQQEAEVPVLGEEDEFGNVKTARKFKRVKEEAAGSGQYGGRFQRRKDGGMTILGVKNNNDNDGNGKGGQVGGDETEMVKGLVLSDDDIEDDDDF